MADPSARHWQILFPDGLTEDQVTRLAGFAADSGIEEPAHGVNRRTVFGVEYDRATVELFRHVFRKVVDGTPLTPGNRLVLADHLAELDTWAEAEDE